MANPTKDHLAAILGPDPVQALKDAFLSGKTVTFMGFPCKVVEHVKTDGRDPSDTFTATITFTI